ncbi:putative Dynein-1-beta heavy chain, flagellar inner arm I1 complex [Blattamonas nauphoetae]|uniref:Dynein-1-beta heavy chain, flagellar inner arm I1 complex n=1 Tax=Blattamonas nauphoetae TaxID=2049346 RepID=A0ABQ9YCD8_9EUKA|nr:putative Dynein-1-beta heavy chain, flagellar inner arm I1 complex [Blattamonas nauphoetae]
MSQHFGNPVPVPDLTGASPAATPQTVLLIIRDTRNKYTSRALHQPTGALFSKAPTFRPKQAKIQISPRNARANHPIDLTQPLFVHPQQQYPPIGVHSSTLVPPTQTSPSSQTQKQFSSPKSGNDGIGSTAATILEYIRNETSFSQSQINTFQRPYAPSHNQNNPYFPRASESSITLVSCYGTFLELAEDMLGARFLQSRLTEANESEITQVFIELTTGKRTIIQLMTHSYANYVVQKLFEVCSDEQVLVLFDAIRGHFSALSFDTFGCRVMQCAIPRILWTIFGSLSFTKFTQISQTRRAITLVTVKFVSTITMMILCFKIASVWQGGEEDRQDFHKVVNWMFVLGEAGSHHYFGLSGCACTKVGKNEKRFFQRVFQAGEESGCLQPGNRSGIRFAQSVKGRRRCFSSGGGPLRSSSPFGILTVAKKMMFSLGREVHITPTSFRELCQSYRSVLVEKRDIIKAAAQKLRSGLDVLKSTREDVEHLRVQLDERKQEDMFKTTEVEELMMQLFADRRNAEEQTKKVGEKRARMLEEEQVARQEAAAAQNELDKVIAAVMILLKHDTSWSDARKKLTDPHFILNLLNFKREAPTDNQMRAVEKNIRMSGFNFESVKQVSAATAMLCKWVYNMDTFKLVFDKVAPIQAEVKAKLALLETKQRDLRESQLTRTNILVSGLAGERARWMEQVQAYEVDLINLFGDVLLSASFLAYGEPFTLEYRP